MSSESGEVKLGRMAATVTDMDAAVAFYCGIFGFQKTFENGNPIGFVILEKDATGLHLSLTKGHKATTQNVAHLLVDDAARLYAICTSRGVRIIKSMRDADFGLRTFVLADPDGNRIDVGQTV